MKYYVAGGAVRDILLNRAVRDVDFVFSGSEEEFIQRNPTARKIQNRNIPLYLLHGQEFAPLQPAGNKPEEDSSEVAGRSRDGDERRWINYNLVRRDFTMNALLLADNGVLHAHPHALQDLKSKCIRPASAHSLSTDPFRALRAARFASDLPDFQVHPDTIQQMRTVAANTVLQDIAAEQAGMECIKACRSRKPGNFLRTLHHGNCLRPWFAEFAGADDIPAGPPAYHNESVLEHTAQVMDFTADIAHAVFSELSSPRHAYASTNEAALAVWMALCHDVGKTRTAGALLPHRFGHEAEGEKLAHALGARLRLPKSFTKAGGMAALLHMHAGRYHTLRPGTKTDLLMALHARDLLRPFAIVAMADSGHSDLLALMEEDLKTILAVTLPEHWRDKGEISGRHLRDLRSMALKKHA